jgi:hypothetical protein
MATQNANAVAITGGTINTVQPATGQSLTIKDEDGNTAIIIGTDNTAAGYLSLNFGSYHGGSGTWSPKDGNNALSLTQNSTAYYIKIGDLVNVFFDVTFANPNPSLSQAMYGLPFTPKTGTSCGSTPAKHSTSTTWGMVVVGGSSRFLAWENDGTYQSLSGQTVIATLTYISD